jgi:hypothetical protein
MIYEFDAPFVAWYPVPNHQQIKDKFLPLIQQHRDSIKSDPKTFSNNSHSSYWCRQEENILINKQLLTSIVWNPLDTLLKEKPLDPTPSDSMLTSIWWNYYYPGGYTHPHKHVTSDFSGVYIMHLDEDDPNTTSFIQTSGESPSYPFARKNYSTEHVTEGHVIIFPSYTLHYAAPCRKDRVIIAWNVVTKFDEMSMVEEDASSRPNAGCYEYNEIMDYIQ